MRKVGATPGPDQSMTLVRERTCYASHISQYQLDLTICRFDNMSGLVLCRPSNTACMRRPQSTSGAATSQLVERKLRQMNTNDPPSKTGTATSGQLNPFAINRRADSSTSMTAASLITLRVTSAFAIAAYMSSQDARPEAAR